MTDYMFRAFKQVERARNLYIGFVEDLEDPELARAELASLFGQLAGTSFARNPKFAQALLAANKALTEGALSTLENPPK